MTDNSNGGDSGMRPATVLVIGTESDIAQQIERHLRNQRRPIRVEAARPRVDPLAEVERTTPALVLIAPAGVNDSAGIVSEVRKADPQLSIALLTDDTSHATGLLTQLDVRDAVTMADMDRLGFVLLREIGVTLDHRRLAARERETQLLEAQQKVLMRQLGVAIAIMADGIVIEANDSFEQCVGTNAAIGLPLLDLVDSDSRGDLRKAMSMLSKGRADTQDLSIKFDDTSGASRPLRVALRTIERDGEQLIELVATPRKAATAETSGPRAQLSQALHDAHREGTTDIQGVFRVEIVDTAQIETSVGFTQFEQLADSVGAFLGSMLDSDDRLFRIAPDVFVVLTWRAGNQRLQATCQRWLEQLADTVFRTHEHQLRVALRGQVYANELHESLDNVMRRLDDHAELHPPEPGVVTLIEPDDDDLKRRKAESAWVSRIQTGLQHRHFSLSYMPILALEESDERLFDALLRMVTPDGKEHAAREFIAVAERNKLIGELDRVVVDEAIEMLMDHERAGHEPMRLFVKLSEDTLTDSTAFLRWLRVRLVGKPGVYRQLIFNIQEPFLQNHLEAGTALCDAIRHFGVGLSIDYFGADAHSDQLLEDIAPDYVKLHSSFTQAVSQPGSVQNTMTALLKRAHALGIEVIAQRVEDADTMAALWQMGVSYVQGYHISAPVLETAP